METSEKIIAIIGLTEAIKQYGIPSKFSPTIAIVIGALIGYFEKPDAQGIFNGILLGATVTGGYSITKRAGQGLIAPLAERNEGKTKLDYSVLEHDDDRGV